MIQICLLIFTLLFSQSVWSYSQKTFIDQLLSSHAFFEKEMINLKIKHIEMTGDRDNYSSWDWDIGAEFGRIHKNKYKYDYTSSTDYARSTNQTVQKISSDLSKKFFSNGSEVNFSFDRSLPVKDEEMHDKNGYQTDKNTTEYLNDLSVSWTLPLLKNKDGIIDQKTYDLSVLDYEDEKLVLAEVQEDFVEDKVLEFIDWVGFKWQIGTVSKTIKRLENARISTPKSNARDKDTLARSIDKHQRLLLSFKSKLKAQNGLLLDSVKRLNFDQDPPKLKHNFKINFINDLESYCQENIRDLKRIDLEMQKNSRYIKTYKNTKMPEFDFTISATKDENKGNYTSYSKSSETDYEAKLVFSYPLSGDVSNQVYLDKYQLKARQIELKYNNKLKDTLSDARKLDTDIKQGLVQLSLISRQLALLKPNQELDLYLAGQGNVRFAIFEQDDYQELQLEKIGVLIDLHKNKLEYNSLLDRLLPE
jgi:hypothetical protein